MISRSSLLCFTRRLGLVLALAGTASAAQAQLADSTVLTAPTPEKLPKAPELPLPQASPALRYCKPLA
ncbi:hypothetical protein [Hymenobacter cellulosilyticus]|uniref:Uncharacterized protein n=1 Tax=Hymenobacter cellulosilyticus TaxID=2932248 RepID=A0A8T9Q0H1_9BACT|nr:hypothetical protein [Hymenobacter cellulosilyticus]UOQ70867.1 hypothetical protein MUN79_19585 [Hymenobacter cellulosilyticus]